MKSRKKKKIKLGYIILFIILIIFLIYKSTSKKNSDNVPVPVSILSGNDLSEDKNNTAIADEQIKEEKPSTETVQNNTKTSDTDVSKKDTLPKYDIKDDSSLTKYVGKGIPFTQITYEPNLVDLVENKYLKSTNLKGGEPHKLRKEAYTMLDKMASDFFDKFGKPIVVYSSYRSYSYQKNSISSSCKESGYCAKEGESEHQLGLAMDLWEASSESKFLSRYSEYYDWLKDNAYKYGFHQSYQNGPDVDGYYIEPWHWRYLGVEMATYLYNKHITYTQFYNSLK